MQKFENRAEGFEGLDDDDLVDGLAVILQNDASSAEEDVVTILEEDADVMEEDDGVEGDNDYNQFTEILNGGRKAIVARKREWKKTGESFILDHFSESMSVHDWMKQNMNGVGDLSMDISKIYGDMCKQRKMQSTFLEQKETKKPAEPVKKIRRSKSVETLSPIFPGSFKDNISRTPSTAKRPPVQRSLSESTHNRRHSTGQKTNPGALLKYRGRLSTVPESPSTLPGSPVRRLSNIRDLQIARKRTVIYSPMQPVVKERYKEVLKSDWFNPNKVLVYEPPSDANSSSESDDDIFLSCKRKFGGKIFEVEN